MKPAKHVPHLYIGSIGPMSAHLLSASLAAATYLAERRGGVLIVDDRHPVRDLKDEMAAIATTDVVMKLTKRDDYTGSWMGLKQPHREFSHPNEPFYAQFNRKRRKHRK